MNLLEAAKAVVAARRGGGEWEVLNEAIGELEDVLKVKPVPKPNAESKLRDHFAGLAMQGLLACQSIGYEYTGEEAYETASAEAYRYANAMIAEKSNPSEDA